MDTRGLPPLASFGSVLLVEFIDSDRFPGQIAEIFPLLKGYCVGRGARVRWIRYGIRTANFFQHGMDAVTLSETELEKLLAAARELRPGLIILTHSLRPEQSRAVVAACPGTSLVLAHELAAQEMARPEPDAFRAQAELDRDSFMPDYAWEPGNSDALRRDRHNIYVTLRAACGYNRCVTSNPCYRGLVLGPEVRTFGCAFCGRTAAQVKASTHGTTPRSWIEKQLRAIASAFPGERAPNALMFENLESARLLRNVLELISTSPLRGTKLFLPSGLTGCLRWKTRSAKRCLSLRSKGTNFIST